MPIIVPSRTIQSSAFMQTAARRSRAAPQPAQKRRIQKGKCRARCGNPARRESSRMVGDRTAVTSFAERNQIGKKPVCARYAVGQFAEKVQAGVNKITFAVLRDEQRAGFR